MSNLKIFAELFEYIIYLFLWFLLQNKKQKMFSFHVWQYIIAASILIIGTMGLHFWFLYLEPKSLVFWKKIDYGWLFPSVLAVFSTVAANQFNDANKAKESAYKRYIDSQKEFNSAVERTNSFECKKLNNKNIKKSFSNYCDWIEKFNIYRKNFDEKNGFSQEFWDHLKASPLKEKNYFNLNWASELQQLRLKEYNEASVSAEKSDELNVYNYSIVLALCLFLVVRATKVTADVIIEKGKSKEIELPKNGFPIIGKNRRKFFIEKEKRREEEESLKNNNNLDLLSEIKKDLNNIIQKIK